MEKKFSHFTVKGYGNLAAVAKQWIEGPKNIIKFNASRESLDEDFFVEVEWLESDSNK